MIFIVAKSLELRIEKKTQIRAIPLKIINMNMNAKWQTIPISGALRVWSRAKFQIF